MKYSIMEDIFNGKRGNGETIKQSENVVKINAECLKFYNSLRESLNDVQKEQLENLLNNEMEVEAETALTHFKEGLKLGLLLFSECLYD